MGKDPAFLFYSKDWIEGTAEMTSEEKGVYIDLLAHQHQKGSLPSEIHRLCKLAGLSINDFLPIWEHIKTKFISDKDNRMVNKKLTQVVTERSEKGIKNKVISVLGVVVKKCQLPYDIKFEAKKGFNINDFIGLSEPFLTESITEWFTERLPKSLEDGNANGNEDGNPTNIINNKLWFLKYYHSDYKTYQSVFNGQSTTEDYFLQWKGFIDFVYENKYEDIFECKFLSPHDFAKLLKNKQFSKEKWDSVLKKILSTGVKPEHNLFFRIPQFMEYGKGKLETTPVKIEKLPDANEVAKKYL